MGAEIPTHFVMYGHPPVPWEMVALHLSSQCSASSVEVDGPARATAWISIVSEFDRYEHMSDLLDIFPELVTFDRASPEQKPADVTPVSAMSATAAQRDELARRVEAERIERDAYWAAQEERWARERAEREARGTPPAT